MSTTITFYNTPSKKKEVFSPLKSDIVTIYTCGPTVYNYLQVGNWITYIRWDILIRTLHLAGYRTQRVLNITDVGHLVSDADEGEDKLQKGARREGASAWDIAKRYTEDFYAGMEALNFIPPEYITKATDYIEQQIDLVKVLEQKGYTYKTDDGIYFNTSKFPTYADFAKLDLEGLQAGARVEASEQKRSPSDFALWKFSPESEQRDMEWDSPWGKGFPGWHLECSAMAMDKLGESIDIHTGGIDHIPIHHTNEIAQSEAATGKQFVRYWLHANFLMVNGTKISKSLGNSITLQDLHAQGFSPMDFRMFTLQSHYRTESNFTWENLMSAQNRLKHWQTIASLRHQTVDESYDENSESEKGDILIMQAIQSAKDSLFDDLNTPQAFAIIEEQFAKLEAQPLRTELLRSFTQLIHFIDDAFGLRLEPSTPDITDEQKTLIHDREQARADKNWSLSDDLRQELAKQGITVRDTSIGSTWERVSY